MDLTDLEGTKFGPVVHDVSRQRLAAFVEATSDDADRWSAHAPPGYGAAVLFDLAPAFLWAPEVVPYTRSLLHSEQRFRWNQSIPVGSALSVEATVDSVRRRGDLYFVGFRAQASHGADTVIESASTFLMGAEQAGAAESEHDEPHVHARAACARPNELADGATSLPKSASRADLVRYAAASGDFNPLHWDHATAVGAGLPGVVCHGLLMAAWMAQLAAQERPGRHDPIVELRVRFRSPLFPGEAAEVVSSSSGGDAVSLALEARAEQLVSGKATLVEE